MRRLVLVFLPVLLAGCLAGRSQAPDCIRQRVVKAEAAQEAFVAVLIEKAKQNPPVISR